MPDLVDTLRAQAADIGQRGINGWGNTMTSAADRIEALEAEVERLTARELNALRLLLMTQHGWPWPQVCDIGLDEARIMTRTNAPLPTEGGEG
jgi:hypothetical protein